MNPSVTRFIDDDTEDILCLSKNLPFLPRIGEFVCFEIDGKLEAIYNVVNVFHLMSEGDSVSQYVIHCQRQQVRL